MGFLNAGYPIATNKFTVSPTVGLAPYQTVQAAVTAAMAAVGSTVYILPGTYNESINWPAGITVVAASTGTLSFQVKINGNQTFSANGSTAFQNISFTGSSGDIWTCGGAGANDSMLEFDNCNVRNTAGNGIVLDSAAGTGQLVMIKSNVLADGGNAIIANDNGTLLVNNSIITCTSDDAIVVANSQVAISNSNIISTTDNSITLTSATASLVSSRNGYAALGTCFNYTANCVVTSTYDVLNASGTYVATTTGLGVGTLRYSYETITGSALTIDPNLTTTVYPVLPTGSSSLLSVYLDTAVTAVTGDNTNYTILFDTVVEDTDSGYDPLTGVYTFAADGDYFFSYSVAYSGISVGQTRLLAFPVLSTVGGAGPGAIDLNAFNVADDIGNAVVTSSGIFSVSAGDTVSIVADVYGGAKTVGIGIYDAHQWTNFNIFKIPAGAGTSVGTISGDSGSVSGSTIQILAQTGSADCGSTVSFSAASATEMDLKVTDGSLNTIIGSGSGVLSNTATSCTGLGAQTLSSITDDDSHVAIGRGALQSANDGSANTAIGAYALNSVVSSGNNTAIGAHSGISLTGGNFNTMVGYFSGTNYVGAESSNILVGNAGVAAENNTIRIGDQGSGALQQDTCFIAGVAGVSVSNLNVVTIDTTTGQLGSQAVAASLTGYTQTHGTALGVGTGATGGDYNTFIGFNAGNANSTGDQNVCVGAIAGQDITSGANNIYLGVNAGKQVDTGSGNCCMGINAGQLMSSGSNNVIIGFNSGQNYTGAETSNICIGDSVGGVTGESNALHIGDTGGSITSAYVAGIAGVSVSNTNMVTINTSTGQLGSQAVPGGGGSLVLIETQTVSSVSAVQFTTGITPTYANYLLIGNFSGNFDGGGESLIIQVSIDAGSTYINSGYTIGNTGLRIGFISGTTYGSINLNLNNLTTGVGNIMSLGQCWDAASGSASSRGDSYSTASTTANAFQIIGDMGATLSGTFTLYGYEQ